MRYITGLVFAVLVAASSVACMSGGNNGNGLIPVLGTPPQKTEVFTGTVAVGGSMFYDFAVANVGDITVTLTSAGPPSTILMRMVLAVGTANACNVQSGVLKDTAAGSTPQINVSQVPSSSYCLGVGIIDPSATGPVTFSITVVHT